MGIMIWALIKPLPQVLKVGTAEEEVGGKIK